MHKFIYFTDSQADDRPLSFRLDDFGASILFKFKDLIHAANQLDADLICGGDLIERPYVSYPFLNRMIQTFQTLKNTFYLILGNHDIVGRNLDSYKKTAIGVMEKAGTLIVLDKPHYDGGYRIVPIHYTEEHRPELYSTDEKSIFVSHNMIVPHSSPFEHLLPSAISPKIEHKDSIVLSGHFHGQFDIMSDGVRFINPGSLGRVSREPSEAKRFPKAILFTLQDGRCTIEDVAIPSAMDHTQVFKEKELEESSSSLDLSDLRNLIHSTKAQVFNISEYIKMIGSTKKIRDGIIQSALNRISEAEEVFHGTSGKL